MVFCKKEKKSYVYYHLLKKIKFHGEVNGWMVRLFSPFSFIVKVGTENKITIIFPKVGSYTGFLDLSH